MKSEKPRCGAKTRSGGTCQKWPLEFSTRCKLHGGKTPASKRKAAERRQEAQIRKALGEVPAENVDPAEALLRLVSMKWAEVHWLRSVVHRLESEAADTETPSPLVWGVVSHDVGTGPEGPIDKVTYQAGANVWWRLLREAEDQLARYSRDALRAGIEQRQLELQEAQALALAQAIHRVLDALTLSPEQARLVPTIVPEVLRALPVGEEK